MKLLRVGLEHVSPIVTACVVLHNICIDREDKWHDPVRLPRPTFSRGEHQAGTVPRAPEVSRDTDRGTRRTPEWLQHNPDPRYRWDSYDPNDTRPLDKQYKTGSLILKAKLLRHVKTCKKCRLFGGRVHERV